MDDTDLNTAVEEAGTGKFIYFSDDISVNLLPLVALIVAGILRKFVENYTFAANYFW